MEIDTNKIEIRFHYVEKKSGSAGKVEGIGMPSDQHVVRHGNYVTK